MALFYEPDVGRLLFDGRPATEPSRAECRARNAVVDQNTHVVQGSLWDNITYAVPDATETDGGWVVELAQLGELVARLPGGLACPLGERGRKPVGRRTATRGTGPGPCSHGRRCSCSTNRPRTWTQSTRGPSPR